jgi:hypothetical protein
LNVFKRGMNEVLQVPGMLETERDISMIEDGDSVEYVLEAQANGYGRLESVGPRPCAGREPRRRLGHGY